MRVWRSAERVPGWLMSSPGLQPCVGGGGGHYARVRVTSLTWFARVSGRERHAQMAHLRGFKRCWHAVPLALVFFAGVHSMRTSRACNFNNDVCAYKY